MNKSRVGIDPDEFIAKSADPFSLKNHPTRLDMFADKSAVRDHIKFEAKQIEGLSHALYSEASRSLLIVLQGMDTSGKGGTTSGIFSRTPPAQRQSRIV